MTAAADLHIVVLAAGASTRFGSPKQLARVQGVPMVQLALSRAEAVAGHAVSVVLGANAAQIAPGLSGSAVTLVINRGWAEGLAASIRAGIEQLPGHTGGALLLLADQCAVTSADLQRLIDVWCRDRQAIESAQPARRSGCARPAAQPGRPACWRTDAQCRDRRRYRAGAGSAGASAGLGGLHPYLRFYSWYISWLRGPEPC